MKAEGAQQYSLLGLAELDAELARIEHRSTRLPERQDYERIQAEQTAAGDRLASVQIALDDLDTRITRLESDVDAVRQREDRDRAMLDSGAINAKQLADLQHELQTLQRRQSDLEDSLLELLERREELQSQQSSESAAVDTLTADLASAQQALDATLADIDTTRRERSAQRAELVAALDPELAALYERQRASGGVGAGRLRGRQCGACRIEIDRGELARISAAADDDVLRCPECGAILLRVKDTGR